MPKTAAAASARWKQNAGQATQNFIDGVQSVKVDPGQAAAANQQAYLQGVQQNVGLWAKNVQTGLGNWQARTVTLGGQRYAGGIEAGAARQEQFMAKFLPRAQAIAAALPQRGTDAANEARMLQNVRELRKLKGTF
jgi:hypothetical protein